MNVIIGKTNAGTWKRINARYIAVACGLALAASALFALVATMAGQQSPTIGSGYSPGSSSEQTGEDSFHVLYLVGSQPEKALFDAVLSTESRTFGSIGASASTLVVGTPQSKWSTAEATRELMQFGVNVRVVDLRTAGAGEVTVAGSAVIEANIMDSVISTERATWVFPEAIQQPMFGSAADAESAVERAFWEASNASNAYTLQ